MSHLYPRYLYRQRKDRRWSIFDQLHSHLLPVAIVTTQAAADQWIRDHGDPRLEAPDDDDLPTENDPDDTDDDPNPITIAAPQPGAQTL